MLDLSPLQQRLILHWGEMGARWGINRTVAQIHALLYLSPRPLNAEEIADTLSIARSNCSTSLKELQSWGIARVVHQFGDRRDHFETMDDVWDMFRKILDERRRREVEPTLTVLRECAAAARAEDSAEAPRTRERIEQVLDFFETVDSMHANLQKLPNDKLIKLAKMSGSLQRLLAMMGR